MMSLIKKIFRQVKKKKSKHEIIAHPIDGHEGVSKSITCYQYFFHFL